ncbi:molybdopterin-guanine dinucleotide biosynthesis protein A [Fulvimarina pelagi HTCC2506]|uniref:Molybdenum cofactor guanylyltransferase n=2 Tax=Fulvimarina pelagi TaxID=217511 RepID=Q0FYE9_9HYPH|nr:molybdenum cofactor guanylyltransferase [Fulvimarina pelagi]EAU40046.1 molybdopterin-guanine dinucleotide biosynthesis protein A [Fulvimarina pelagi HTCC2506]BAT31087.1 molybdopterin-guanine dinucleotide biosynthesis protein A [Fulvimarina pelagi]
MRAGAIILAAGRGSRMGEEGEPKPLRRLAGRPMIAHVVERLAGYTPILVNAPADGSFDAFGEQVVPDVRAGFQGPLAGIEAGLSTLEKYHEEITHAIILPSDTPFLPIDIASRLVTAAKEREIVSVESGGRLHPTVALWPVTLLSTLSRWLDDERPRALRHFLKHVGYSTIAFNPEWGTSGPDPFSNINTPEELAAAERFLTG